MIAMFPLGRIVATPGALGALERANQSTALFLARHAGGDWGELGLSGLRRERVQRAVHGLSTVEQLRHAAAGEKLWIITEADRSSTTLLLPDEY